MFISFILVLLLPTALIGIGSYFISKNILTQKLSSSFSETMFYLRNSVEKELYQIKQISAYIYIDLDLKEAITLRHNDPAASKLAEEKVLDKLKNYLIASTFSKINALKVYGFNGFSMSFGQAGKLINIDDSKIVNSQYYEEALRNNGMALWAGIQDSFLISERSEKEQSLSIFRVIKDKTYKQNIGIVYLNVDSSIFSSLTEQVNQSTSNQIYILDNKNKIVNQDDSIGVQAEIAKVLEKNSNTDPKGFFIKMDQASKLNYFCYFINDFNWKVVGIVPVNAVTKDNRDIFSVTAAAFAISFIFSCFIWFFVSSSIVGPIKQLNRATRLVRDGNFDIQVKNSSKDELGDLTRNFNYMVLKIDSLLQEVIDENMRKKDAEYKALQAQINPHFLYNTLNAIRWMAIVKKAENIKNVVDALGRLLRNSTSKMSQFITIREELENLKDYIYIQKIAYKNKFQIEWDVDEKVLDFKCIKFILQPIVENAIFHGILPKKHYGTIWISIILRDDIIQFTVKDDGVGMSSEDIEKVLSLSDKTIKKFSGIGINNIYERIQMTYKGYGALSIESKLGEFTTITIRIPVTDSMD